MVLAQHATALNAHVLMPYSFDDGHTPGISQTFANLSHLSSTVNLADNGDDKLSYFDLSFLTLQAVFQTVIICLFGYFASRAKILNPTVQRHVSMLNVQIFTPCLIFAKLASSLSLSALVDIAIIPVLFVITTGISMLCAVTMSRIFKFNTQESNFVTAMAVFGNSNSLPVSLTVSLAYTLPSLTWPEIPNDNQDDVASRGILYLLIFQQLGQIVRWSWGYNTLLAKPQDVKLTSQNSSSSDDITVRDDQSWDEEACLGADVDQQLHPHKDPALVRSEALEHQRRRRRLGSSGSLESVSSSTSLLDSGAQTTAGNSTSPSEDGHDDSRGPSTVFAKICHYGSMAYAKFMAFMNPPLWSMLIAILVASIPAAKHELFETNGFVNHTLTSAIKQVGGIAIPMILVVLGANLAPNDSVAPASKHHSRIIFASLMSRMVLPSFFLLPIIALSVKYLKLSILDDPIFLLVAFILTVSPPAIQLSQICQLNEVFEKEMAGVLFWGYVVLTLPSTIAIVVASLNVLDWAGTTRM
jgi:predicted permease